MTGSSSGETGEPQPMAYALHGFVLRWNGNRFAIARGALRDERDAE
jgi:hypothetical protein